MIDKKPEPATKNPEEVIERLIKENSFLNQLVTEAKYELSSIGGIDGLSFLGAVKALVKKHKETEKVMWELQEQLKKLNKDKK